MPEATQARLDNSYHHGNLRAALLEIASRHLEDVGPDKLSLRALAREAGVSQTAPYRHFEDKGALLAALAAKGYRDLQQCTESACESCETAAEQIVQSGLAYIRFAQQHPALYKLMFGPVIEDPLTYPDLQQAGKESFEVIIGIVQRGLQEGSFSRERPDLIAMSCWSMVHGIASLSIDGMYTCAETDLPDDQLIEGALRLALTGILARQ